MKQPNIGNIILESEHQQHTLFLGSSTKIYELKNFKINTNNTHVFIHFILVTNVNLLIFFQSTIHIFVLQRKIDPFQLRIFFLGIFGFFIFIHKSTSSKIRLNPPIFSFLDEMKYMYSYI